MLKHTIAAVLLTLLAMPAAQAGSDVHKNLDSLLEGKGKASKVLSELFEGKDMKNMDSVFAKFFGSSAKSNSDDADDDDSADDSVASAEGPCVSAADGKPGTNNSAPGSGNGGKGGTVILKSPAAPGDCYSANGGNGGSNNYVSSKNNNQTGNGGAGGKIIAR